MSPSIYVTKLGDHKPYNNNMSTKHKSVRIVTYTGTIPLIFSTQKNKAAGAAQLNTTDINILENIL